MSFKQYGNAIDAVAPAGGIKAGGVVIEDLFGVAIVDTPENKPFALQVSGVFNLPKGDEGISFGKKVYWKDEVVTLDNSAHFIGYATQEAASSETKIAVRLSV